MDCIEALKTRRSIRKFKPDMIPEADLFEILDTGHLAPTAGNYQPWEFIVVKRREKIDELQKAAFGQELLATAPVVVVVCADPVKSEAYGKMGMEYFCLLDCANATNNILLAAHAMGYGGCWMGGFSEKEVRKVLNIPDNIRVVSLIPLGKRDGEPWIAPKRSLSDILHWGQWGDKSVET